MANAGDHKPNDFTPVVGALDLVDYVLQITDNQKTFPDFSVREKKDEDGTATRMIIYRADSLTNIVRAEAREILHLTAAANRINLNREPWRKEERLGKQRAAIEKCGELLIDIQLCRKRFHLSTKRVKYWGKMVRDLRTSIEGWHEKDKARYRDI